jgi:hypothetical protein
VQDFIEEFRKKSLTLNISLHSTKTLLKYIGAFHSYIRHNILLLNPTNLDEVCVQAMHLESRGMMPNLVLPRSFLSKREVKTREKRNK